MHNEELRNLFLPANIIKETKQNEVGWACGTHDRREKSVQGMGGKARRKETTRKNEA
jgi:hypothetical protein